MTANTVLVTGAQGFTGKYVCHYLREAGFDVVELSSNFDRKCRFVADLNDITSLRRVLAATRPNYVIHLAAIASVTHSNPLDYYRTNLFGTLNLLEAIGFEVPDLIKVVIASSANVYGNPQCSPVSELTCPSPINHYAMSKLGMEYLLRTWQSRLPVIIARPFNYTGRGQSQDFLIPKIVFHYASRRQKMSIGNIDVIREFNDVRMIAQAYVGLLLVDPGCTVNLCTGLGYRLEEIFSIVEEMSKHKLCLEVDPDLIRKNDLKILVGDPSLLIKLLPSLPAYHINDTLSWMYEAMIQ